MPVDDKMIQVGFRSDKGIRRRNNEDAFYVMPEDRLFIVADGVGGNNAGEIASRTAVNYIADYVRQHSPEEIKDDIELRRYFTDCFAGVNDLIYGMAHRHPENTGMATTAVLAYINGDKAYIVNVGDSRAYMFRDGILSQLTEDHSYVNSLIKSGSITKEEARRHRNKNVITRAVGGEEVIFPDFFQLSVQPGDIFMLCTDGLHGEVDDIKLAEIIGKGRTMSETCAELVKKANQNGGNDNITVICFRIGEEKPE